MIARAPVLDGYNPIPPPIPPSPPRQKINFINSGPKTAGPKTAQRSEGERKFYCWKNGQLRCRDTHELKSQCIHCNPMHYTGKDGHKYCRATNKRKVLCNCENCTRAGVNKGLCIHGRQKYKCKECGGASLCEHGRQKSRCKDCFDLKRKPAGICKHGKERYRCNKCA